MYFQHKSSASTPKKDILKVIKFTATFNCVLRRDRLDRCVTGVPGSPALGGGVLCRQVLASIDRDDERVLVEAVPHGAVERAKDLVLIILRPMFKVF
jgi:hypothetical protein